MFYVLTLLPVSMLSVAIIRYWDAVRRLGYANEVIRGAPDMLPRDALSLFLATMVLYWTAHSWYGFTLPIFQKEPFAEWETMFMAGLCCFASIGLAFFNSSNRFTNPTVAGMREAALRTLAALRILDATELAHAIKVAEAHRAKSAEAKRTIDADEE